MPRAAPGPDPRGPHHTLRTPAGSSLAWWSIGPATPRHRTPVVFLHGGPGTFARNRDFDASAGWRNAGFRTVYYDQSGSGASGDLPIAQYTLANAVADFDALRFVLGADKICGGCDYLPRETAARYMRAFPAAQRIDVPGRGHGFFRP